MPLESEATIQVLLGNNIRTQTEPLTRQRIAEISGALLMMFHTGALADDSFLAQMSANALAQLERRGAERHDLWLAQWALGLTGKGVQNVLPRDESGRKAYVSSFESAISGAATSLRREFGEINLRLGFDGNRAFSWHDVLRLTTLLGCAELAVRGSDKSRYGKLFERLVLGSALTCLGFSMSAPHSSGQKSGVFWLSDSSDDRECDATAIVTPGVIARFDLGFIGIGNPEIVRDKLSRFAQQARIQGQLVSSRTFVIVDRYPAGPTANSIALAAQSGACLLQMSMSLWPKQLARELGERTGYRHALADMDDLEAAAHVRASLKGVNLLQFLTGVAEDSSSDDT